MDIIIHPIKKPYIKNGLVLYIDGNDFKNSPNTTTMTDRSLIGNNGTPANFAYTAASGADGFGGIQYDGSNDVINFGHSTTFNSSYITLETLISVSVDPIITGHIIAKELTTGQDSYALAITSSRAIVFLRAGASILFSSAAIPKNVLTHIVLKTDGTNAKLFINGRWDNGVGHALTTPVTTNDVLIGNNPSLNRQFKGNLKMARIYNRPLLDSEIVQNYKSTK
jgi:hypothetical protein